MEQKFLIEDESNDKKYFTIVPNYILNHSTHTDQSVYIQMKRLTDNSGKNVCYPSYKYLMKQCGIGKVKLKKSIEYLIKHKWIENIGKRQIKTKGGWQWVQAYKINDIWKLNIEYYQGGSETEHLEHKGGPELPQGGSSYSGIRRTLKKNNNTKVLEDKSSPLINFFISQLKEQRGIASLDETTKQSRQYSYLLKKKIIKQWKITEDKEPTDEQIKKIFLNLLAKTKKDQFFRKNATSIKFIYYNFNKILEL